WYVDTHAGAAGYRLDEAWAQQNAEFETGIARLWPHDDAPSGLATYLQLVRRLDSRGELKYYPGSADIAMHRLREQDRLRLFELHSTESRTLGEHFAEQSPRVMVRA